MLTATLLSWRARPPSCGSARLLRVFPCTSSPWCRCSILPEGEVLRPLARRSAKPQPMGAAGRLPHSSGPPAGGNRFPVAVFLPAACFAGGALPSSGVSAALCPSVARLDLLPPRLATGLGLSLAGGCFLLCGRPRNISLSSSSSAAPRRCASCSTVPVTAVLVM
ncbi:hypothetical protein GDO78_016051 [Eleutherodactylus coqui]|uniref:Uncharacterized protein n=1 Tax=Eleutherodactylus coqui TaxID=57060 RepID=A0A8J6JJ36_ELECQ|nr:hypothetical protein GDO78_016051 [Eleutherodactylus coqui]